MKRFATLCIAIAALFAAQSILATDYTWDGGAPTPHWPTNLNWVGDVAPTMASGNNLIFTGSTQLINTNNYAANSDIGAIVFDASAGSFSLRGNALDMYTGLVNQNASWQTNYTQLRLNGSIIVSNDGLIHQFGTFVCTNNTWVVTKQGSGMLWIDSGVQSTQFTGTFITAQGTLRCGNVNALGPENCA